jgi:hypothetical protein
VKIKLWAIARDQLYNTMAILGTMSSTVYGMRRLGFNDPLPWKSEFYPAYVLGFFVGLMIKAYYGSNENQEY